MCNEVSPKSATVVNHGLDCLYSARPTSWLLWEETNPHGTIISTYFHPCWCEWESGICVYLSIFIWCIATEFTRTWWEIGGKYRDLLSPRDAGAVCDWETNRSYHDYLSWRYMSICIYLSDPLDLRSFDNPSNLSSPDYFIRLLSPYDQNNPLISYNNPDDSGWTDISFMNIIWVIFIHIWYDSPDGPLLTRYISRLISCHHPHLSLSLSFMNNQVNILKISGKINLKYLKNIL